LSARLGLSRQTDPVRIEADLMPLFPREDWAMLAHVLIFHGRRVCDARAPKCDICTLNEICPSSAISTTREEA
jgi:endonuclease-3